MCFPFPGFRRRQSSFFYPSLDALFMFCSALTFPRRLADTRDCFSNRQAKHRMNSLSKHEPFFFCGTISASQEFLLFYYFALQQTSRGFFCYFFFHDVDFFLLGQPKQHTPQWPLSPNMEPSPGCRTSQLHTSTDLRNTRHLRCNFTTSSPLLIFPNFSSILTFYFLHSTSTRNRFPTHTLQLLYCNFSWGVYPLRCTTSKLTIPARITDRNHPGNLPGTLSVTFPLQ